MRFGNSITWGQDPGTRARHAYEARWPGALQRALPDVRVIEEPLCDRTTIWDDPYVEGSNGKTMLRPLLESHAPVAGRGAGWRSETHERQRKKRLVSW